MPHANLQTACRHLHGLLSCRICFTALYLQCLILWTMPHADLQHVQVLLGAGPVLSPGRLQVAPKDCQGKSKQAEGGPGMQLSVAHKEPVRRVPQRASSMTPCLPRPRGSLPLCRPSELFLKSSQFSHCTSTPSLQARELLQEELIQSLDLQPHPSQKTPDSSGVR